MGYVGVPPQSGFITTAKQRVTSSTNNYVDLDHSISSLADVIVWVNFVKQDSTNLSLTTSSRITLGANLVASDICEIAFLGKAVATQSPPIGGVSNDMLAGSIANSKLANSSITLNGSAVSLGGSATVGGTNTPNFHVYLNANQNVTSGATTKVNFNTEVYDSSNAYDNSSNYRYTPQTAGLYKFYMGVTYFADADNFNFNFAKITMNGSGNVIATGDVDMRFARGRRMTGVASCIQQMNGSSDFVEVFAFVQSNGSSSAFVGDTDKSTYFGGYKLIT